MGSYESRDFQIIGGHPDQFINNWIQL